MKTKILNSIREQATKLEKYARKISPGFDMEDIHRFRTATKKMRSLLRLLNIDKVVLPASFQKLYRILGDLRNAQLALVALKEQDTPAPGLIMWLATSIGRLEAAWNKVYNRSIVRKLSKKLSVVKAVRIDTKTIRNLFREKLTRMKTVIQAPAPTDESLHDTRKLIKDMQYLRQWCRTHWVNAYNITRDFQLAQLKTISEQAGNFNDQRTELLLMAAYTKKEKNKKALQATQALIKRKDLHSTRAKEDLVKSLSHFSNSEKHGVRPGV